MKKRVKKITLSRQKGARVALAKSLVQAIIISERIKTTKARAKFAQSHIEKLLKTAKKDTLASNRRIFAALGNKAATKKLIKEISPKFAGKTSGFTRVINLGARAGDAAPMALLEFAYSVKEQKGPKETKEVKETGITREPKESKVAKEVTTKGEKNGKKS